KLNVDRNWRDSLTFVLFNRDGKFGNPGRFLNQVVRVRGMVGDYKGAVQIKVESPGDIEIVTPDSEGPSEESTGTEADVVAAGDESISADSEESAAEAPEVESVEEAPAEETSSSAITWQEAVKKIGQQVTVEATIVSVYDPAARGKGGPVKLNTDRNWKESLTIVFYAKSRSGMDQGFGNPGRFLNKKVRVTGEVSEHQGAPQIMLRNPSQIEVIQ
nr:hypothetical protein [bacterium]